MELAVPGIFMGAVIAVIAVSKGKRGALWFLYGFLIWPVALVHVIVTKRDVATGTMPGVGESSPELLQTQIPIDISEPIPKTANSVHTRPNQRIKFDYLDGSGRISTHEIRVAFVWNDGDAVLFSGHASATNPTQTFRADRIRRMTDLRGNGVRS